MLLSDGSKTSTSGRDPAQRRKYANDPWGYFSDILGITTLTDDQARALQAVVSSDRVLMKASNGIGKTHLLAALGVWWMDAVAAQLDDEGREQGARWIMTAPDASTVDSTIWARALEHMGRAQRLGFDMPGEYSDKSVLWRVPGEDWGVEKLSPPKRVGQEQQHGASGRHHRNLLITIDEGPGVDAARYRAAEGMASGTGNKIVVAGNPTESVGPYAQKADSPEYTTIRISSLDHPNVIERREVIPGGAIGYRVVDTRVATQCFDRGEYTPGKNEPDPAFFDFLYRLHPWVGDNDNQPNIPDPMPVLDESYDIGGIEYNVIGHRDGPLHIYRPDGRFLSSTMGHFPLEGSGGLFPAVYIDRAFEAWLGLNASGVIRELERTPYARVGVDPAEEGGDSPMATPIWKMGERWVCDRIRDLRRGLDDVVAGNLYQLFGREPEYVVDAIGVGSGVATRLANDLECNVERFKASESAWNDEDAGEPEFYNKRAAAYWRASELLKRGKVVMPPDAELKEELMSHTIENRNGKVLVTPKKKIRKDILGRSPDKSDSFVQGLWSERQAEEGGAAYAPTGGRSANRLPPTSYDMYRKDAA